ncbi:TetR/AcrR family transcriptional regulator [Flavobacterium album]|uniref:TetR/AcrR family transcriptional regulator n=1 Tax=Flavobacterium album TaxID=2175091 RepID=A0A2S1QV17_9FLAO|nr:TetR/AcrR family transcriptional regulator [Flavobacterium album]AWH84091.1 TetR/AcrR family transcriptional regulator [Flavobacterium album]
MTKAEKTRQFIIEKTAPVFNRKGYAGTSLSDITEATGLTKGSIYGNFSNKDEVALAVFDYNFGLMSSIIKKKIDDKPNAIDKLKVYLTLYSQFILFPALEGGCPVLNTAIEADDTHEALRSKAASAIEKWHKTIQNIIKEGQEKGQVRKGAAAKDFALAFIALVEGGIMITKVTGKMEGFKTAMKQAEKMIDKIAK